MIQLSSYSNEWEAQLLESQLKAAGIDYRSVLDGNNGVKIMVFEDDLELAREILDSGADDEGGFSDSSFAGGDLDDFSDDVI